MLGKEMFGLLQCHLLELIIVRKAKESQFSEEFELTTGTAVFNVLPLLSGPKPT